MAGGEGRWEAGRAGLCKAFPKSTYGLNSADRRQRVQDAVVDLLVVLVLKELGTGEDAHGGGRDVGQENGQAGPGELHDDEVQHGYARHVYVGHHAAVHDHVTQVVLVIGQSAAMRSGAVGRLQRGWVFPDQHRLRGSTAFVRADVTCLRSFYRYARNSQMVAILRNHQRCTFGFERHC